MIRSDTTDVRDTIKAGVLRLWNSPTVTTWASMGARSLAGLLLLPLVVTSLSTEEVTVWFLLNSVLLLQMLADIGFGATFARAVAYAMGGAESVGDYRVVPERPIEKEPNWKTVFRIIGTMRVVYRWIALAWILLLAVLGTWALNKPISMIPDPSTGWLAWVLIIFSSSLFIRCYGFAVFLQGSNEIAMFRRWDAVTSFAGILTASVALLLGGTLAVAVAALQVWVPVKILVNRGLCRRAHNGAYSRMEKRFLFDSRVFSELWPPAWRSGAGILLTAGLIQASGFFFAQIGTSAQVASYLLALNLIHGVSALSRAPFYSKLPILAKLRVQGRVSEQIRLALIGMRRSYLVYVFVFLAIGILGPPALRLIGSNAEFPAANLWNLLGVAFFAERYGAMHIQLYSTTNHIIWHIANGVSGVIYVLVGVTLYPILGVYSFPTGIFAGYAGMYCWYAAYHSYNEFKLQFWEFESACMLRPAAILVTYIIVRTGLVGVNY